MALGADAPTMGCMGTLETAEQALAFVHQHGVVLVSAKGKVPRLTEAIVGEPITGSWWAHTQSRHIYTLLEAVTASEEVLVCRLLERKITLVHRRLWPALVRIAKQFAPEQLALVRQQHTASGRHVNHEIPFPEWVPADVVTQAQQLTENEAEHALRASWPWPQPGKPQ